ncbi:MAG: hypothetical protein IPL55_19830 [Saprospiraceae bacterium]|jgi:hypothetical protein|nr:hypothetical protein [Saprospiraceae bacterium]
MARQGGLLKVVGKLDDLSFYKSADGFLVRTKGGVSADRINSDPTFQRTRENNAEFGMSAAAGKLLRTSVRNLMMTASDNRVTARLTRLMTDVKNLDAANDRGERHVHEGFDLPEGKAVLKGFNFNDRAILSGILFKAYALNTTSGALDITGLVPAMDIVSAPGATHVNIKAGWSKVDFATGEFETVISNAVNLPINGTSGNVALTQAVAPTLASGINVFTLQIEFYQEVNGNQYSLKNGGYNALAVIDVV